MVKFYAIWILIDISIAKNSTFFIMARRAAGYSYLILYSCGPKNAPLCMNQNNQIARTITLHSVWPKFET